MIASDASPLIGLARIGHLDLLEQLYGDVAIPPEVEREIVRHPHGFGGLRPGWVRTAVAVNSALIRALSQDLDAGEAEAIARALELGTDLLIDERAGRQAAEARGLRVVGTLGAILDARQRGLIPRVAPLIEELQATGFYLSERVAAQVRQVAGE